MADKTQSWWDQLEDLANLLGQYGPDDLCCDGLTRRQAGILRTLVRREGALLGDLAAEAGVTAGAMTRLLDRLEALELVERVRGANGDGRAASVRITARGRKVRGQIDALMLERTATIVDAIPESKRASVLKALELLNKALAVAGCCTFNAPAELVQISKEKTK